MISFIDDTGAYKLGVVSRGEDVFYSDIEPKPVSAYSWGYYKQIIELCVQNGISLAIAAYPRENTES